MNGEQIFIGVCIFAALVSAVQVVRLLRRAAHYDKLASQPVRPNQMSMKD